MLIARDGRETPIHDSGAPIISADGTIEGVVLLEPIECQAVIDEAAASLRPLTEQNGLEFSGVAPASRWLSRPIGARSARFGVGSTFTLIFTGAR